MSSPDAVPHVAAAAAMWGRRCRGVLVLTLSLAVTCTVAAQAQVVASQCPSRPEGRQLARGWYLTPHTAATQSAGRLLLGWPYLHWRGGIADVTKPDTNGVGLIVHPRGRPTVIQQPVLGHLFDSPKVGVIDPHAVDVIFSATRVRPILGEIMDTLIMWGGRLVDGRWQDVAEITRLSPDAIDRNQIVGDGTRHRGEVVAAAISWPDRELGGEVVLIRGNAKSWRVQRTHPSLFATSYADLLSFRDTLWLAVTAARLDNAMPRTFGLWLMYEGAAGWSNPRLIAVGDGMVMREPRLLGTTSGLLASWIDGEAESTRLLWRATAVEGPSPLQQRPIERTATRGLEAWQHLIGTAVNDSTGQVLELSASGSRVVAEFPTVQGFAPLVFGDGKRPVGIVPGAANALVPIPVWLVEHDLRCVMVPSGLALKRNGRASLLDARSDSPP